MRHSKHVGRFKPGPKLAAETANPMTLHPYCQTCGWRKGGRDSWNGFSCKCGHSEPSPDGRTLSDILKSRGVTTTRDSQTDTDGKRGWWDKDDNQMGRFDEDEGWAIVEKNGW